MNNTGSKTKVGEAIKISFNRVVLSSSVKYKICLKFHSKLGVVNSALAYLPELLICSSVQMLLYILTKISANLGRGSIQSAGYVYRNNQ